MDTPPLILGSTSRYRRELLERLRLPFTVVAPQVDETPAAGEAPAALALRLALAKARAVAALHPQAVVIGSDQVADLAGEPIGKPGTHKRAREQLQRMSGREVVFQTAVAVARADTGFARVLLAPVRVRFRALGDAEIERYLQAERPYDCAGSAKSEALGIALLEAIQSDDPTALVGLPLIRTCTLLREAGLDPLAATSPQNLSGARSGPADRREPRRAPPARARRHPAPARCCWCPTRWTSAPRPSTCRKCCRWACCAAPRR